MDGTEIWSVDKDGTVHGVLLQGAKGKFDAKDAFVIEAEKGKTKLKNTITVDEKGTLQINQSSGGKIPPFKVVGPVKAARRTAALLSLGIARPVKEKKK